MVVDTCHMTLGEAPLKRADRLTLIAATTTMASTVRCLVVRHGVLPRVAVTP
jgi:hypothetical protein